MVKWDACEHEWKIAPGDWDSGIKDTEEVICIKCQCPGERDNKTNEVCWPAT
jgi:hypothetical protein